MRSFTRWGPVNPLAKCRDGTSRFFEQPVFRGFRIPTSLTVWTPPLDIFETEHELVFKAELPGMNAKDIDVRVENNALTLSGERRYDKEFKEENALRMERYYGTFSRTFLLPNTVKLEVIKAEYKNGVLSIKLPKLEEEKPKQTKIAVF